MRFQFTTLNTAIIVFVLLAFQAVKLYVMGQPLISASGMIELWHGVVASPENSQQISDWYTFSHIIHGILFYLALWYFFPKTPVAFRFALAVGIEAMWEVIENSPWIIDRYREQALAQGYIGDSVINSVCDTAAMTVGFLAASRFRLWASVASIILIELLMLYMIRDSLTLNIIQLLHPIEAISEWQAT